MKKINTHKTIGMTFSLIAGLFTALTAEAISVSDKLGTPSVAADAYTFTCGTGTSKVQVRVMDQRTIVNTSAAVYTSLGKDGTPSPSPSVFDTESTTATSPWAVNTVDGPGNYVVLVNKSWSGPDDYTLEGQCLNSLGQVIGPLRFILNINQ